ncbi:MAG: hypothetical protein IJJ96_07180 [Bacteroidales bacterium]|nr:hypothetical protein [Bacteroidales bacterium]
MRYEITRKELQNDALAETLDALYHAYSEINACLYLVGAAARDICSMLLNSQDAPRKTMDLDVAVALKEWGEYDRLTGILIGQGFEKGKQKQKFYYSLKGMTLKYEVDIVPFGALAENETVAWPPEGDPVMSVRCFEDVMRASDYVTVDGRFSFHVASLPGQWLIKLDAWEDRHLLTRKDASDMMFLMENAYVLLALASESIPEEVNVDAASFDLTVAGAEWIASELSRILTREHRSYYSDLILREVSLAVSSCLLNDLYDNSRTSSFESVLNGLRSMAKILANKLQE